MNEPARRDFGEADAALRLEPAAAAPAASYAGRTRYTQLEYEALLGAAQAYAAERSRDIRPVIWPGLERR